MVSCLSRNGVASSMSPRYLWISTMLAADELLYHKLNLLVQCEPPDSISNVFDLCISWPDCISFS